MLHFLLITLFSFSLSRDIIRNLPYNIYQIEDMNQYETKNLPEGNRFYIKLPKNIEKDTTFYLTIPKDITLFPIYSSEFSEKPKDEEIINTNYKNEIQLKNRENQEYSIYSFNIEKSDSYKVLYFQNNEDLNYLSFFASNADLTSTNYDIINYNMRSNQFTLEAGYTRYFVVKLIPEDENLEIDINAFYPYDYNHYSYIYPDFSLGYYLFSNENDTDITNQNKYHILPYSSTNYDYDRYQKRIYDLKNTNKFQYLGIKIENRISYLPQSLSILVRPEYSLPWWAILLIVVGAIIFIIFMALCLRTEKGRAAFCACLLILCICCTSSRRR